MARCRSMELLTSDVISDSWNQISKEFQAKITTRCHFFINKHLLSSSNLGSRPEFEDTKLINMKHSHELRANFLPWSEIKVSLIPIYKKKIIFSHACSHSCFMKLRTADSFPQYRQLRRQGTQDTWLMSKNLKHTAGIWRRPALHSHCPSCMLSALGIQRLTQALVWSTQNVHTGITPVLLLWSAPPPPSHPTALSLKPGVNLPMTRQDSSAHPREVVCTWRESHAQTRSRGLGHFRSSWSCFLFWTVIWTEGFLVPTWNQIAIRVSSSFPSSSFSSFPSSFSPPISLVFYV